MAEEKEVVEFRGCDNLVFAEVKKDTQDKIEFGEVKLLSAVAEISKAVDTSTGTSYYDNKPTIVIDAEGADTITLTVAALPLAILAEITGKDIDETTGAFLDGERKSKYFALGYRTQLTDGTNRYVWRYKGSFAIPEEASKTKDAGTDTTNQTLTYTGIMTKHNFTKNKKSQKALVVDERDGKADLSTFFDQVTTCDTLKPKSVEPQNTKSDKAVSK